MRQLACLRHVITHALFRVMSRVTSTGRKLFPLLSVVALFPIPFSNPPGLNSLVNPTNLVQLSPAPKQDPKYSLRGLGTLSESSPTVLSGIEPLVGNEIASSDSRFQRWRADEGRVIESRERLALAHLYRHIIPY
jgi:hypothetical protein